MQSDFIQWATTVDRVTMATISLLVIVFICSVATWIKLNRALNASTLMLQELQGARQGISSLPDTIHNEAREIREDQQRGSLGNMQMQESRLSSMENSITVKLAESLNSQAEQLSGLRKESLDSRAKLEESIRASSSAFSEAQSVRLRETNEAVLALSERLLGAQKSARDEQAIALQGVTEKIAELILANAEKQDALKTTLSTELEKLRNENAEKLEQMRTTVDEKLQGTLEKRLGESFQLVSDRLELVHRGLGEMQSLATGVGDLKRVLSNVKSRGGWGEVQLGMLLEDMLTKDQYATNARVQPGSSEMVEYAVRLPGKSDDAQMLLPIDAKFPHEDYERLLLAQDGGLAEEIEKAISALERAVKLQAKTISEKYVHPPYTTDFAILYLPTEGLFAEVIRRPGLVSDVQTKYRVMIQGPTTLAALLTSLQMGFRTLAIEKRSSEVWAVLGAAKAEFQKYGDVWDKLGKQLDTARKTVEEAGKRTRAVTRKLKDVELFEAVSGTELAEFISAEVDSDGDIETDIAESAA